MQSNELICTVFEKLRDLRVSQGEEWRAKAYDKIIPVIRNYPITITSGKQASSIPGVGKSMSSRIDEILATGTSSELQGVDTFKEDIIKEFMTVQGVGRITAEKWYDAGYRTIAEIPQEICTDAQKLGIYFHADLQKRIPREEIDKVKDFLNTLGITFEIAGSYRRELPSSGDIDILLLGNDLDRILQTGIIQYQLARGDKKFMGIGLVGDTYRRIDIEIVQPEEYPFALLYFTGPMSFNIKMRERAAQLGFRLNEKALYDSNGNVLVASSESDVFNALGLQYLTPEERNNY